MGSKCSKCGAEYFPPVYLCGKCGSDSLVDRGMPRQGRILTYTVLHRTLPGFEAPLGLAVVQLSNGARVLGQVTAPPGEQIESGARVRVVFGEAKAGRGQKKVKNGYRFLVVR